MSNPYPPPNDPGNPGQPIDPLRKQPDPNAAAPGAYPPPSGSYPPPGAYPPPPPPGGVYPPPPVYGQPPAGYPPAPGYGPPGGFAPQFNLGDALSYGWERFAANALSWIATVILVGVGVLVAYLIGVLGVLAAASGGSTVGAYFALAVVVIIFVFALLLTQVVVANGALLETQVGDRSLGAFFRIPNAGKAIGTALLVGLIVAIGTVLFYLPGIIAAYLLSFSLYFAISRGMSPTESISASVRLVTSRFGDTILLFIVLGLINFVGGLLCGIGVFVTLPLTAIATAYAYKVLNGEQVAPATQ